MNHIDLLIARTQRNITYLYGGLFGLVLAALIFSPRPLDETVRTILITLLGVLGTLITMQNQFWFARPRTSGIPDPTATTTRIEQLTTPTATPPAAQGDPP